MLNSHVFERGGQRADDPIGVLADIGALGPRLLMNHAIHLTDDELTTVASHDARVWHCPLSNMTPPRSTSLPGSTGSTTSCSTVGRRTSMRSS